jgi:hypothetical protein
LRQHACGWESYFDQRSIADFAGYAKAGVIGFNQGFGYRQAKAGSTPVQSICGLTEWLKRGF